MKFIAITGSFASGKSFVSEYIAKKGYKVFSCDDYVRKLYLDSSIKKKIIDLIEITTFDKKEIIKIIYNDEFKRKKLENYIHPLVRKGISKFKEQYFDQDLLFVEIPLLFESGFNKHFDYSICVYCSEKNRLARAKERDNFNLEIYNKIKKIQMSLKEKIILADFLINTDLDFADTTRQIEEILENVRS